MHLQIQSKGRVEDNKMDEAQPLSVRQRKSFDWKVVCKRAGAVATGQLIGFLALLLACIVTGNYSLARQFFQFLDLHFVAVIQTMLVFSLVISPLFCALSDAVKAFFGESFTSEEG